MLREDSEDGTWDPVDSNNSTENSEDESEPHPQRCHKKRQDVRHNYAVAEAVAHFYNLARLGEEKLMSLFSEQDVDFLESFASLAKEAKTKEETKGEKKGTRQLRRKSQSRGIRKDLERKLAERELEEDEYTSESVSLDSQDTPIFSCTDSEE